CCTRSRRRAGVDKELLRQLVVQRPCGLLTDIDGTISPIAPTPHEARVSPLARAALQRLARQLDLVAVISGRAAADAAALVGLPELLYVGNHGLERAHGDRVEPVAEATAYTAAIDAVLHAVQERVVLPGVLFENKGVTAAIHYRLAEQPDQAERLLGEILQELVALHGLLLTPGRMVWELRPPLMIDKGTVARRLVEEFALRSVIFLGDDHTDADAFRVLRELRDQSICATLSIGVAGAETPAVVRELADVLVAGVAGVERLLVQIEAILAETTSRAEHTPKDG
ncbi:MAG TPA: trehalose-phosphatase, partial [Herpetosiphonaceae bacterium]